MDIPCPGAGRMSIFPAKVVDNGTVGIFKNKNMCIGRAGIFTEFLGDPWGPRISMVFIFHKEILNVMAQTLNNSMVVHAPHLSYLK